MDLHHLIRSSALTCAALATITHSSEDFLLSRANLPAAPPDAQAPKELSNKANYTTDNFVVSASAPALAEEVGLQAEILRKQYSLEFFGYEMANWQPKCVLDVELAREASGQTTFKFNARDLKEISCKVLGTPRAILDSALPHETVHMVLASRYNAPPPRWINEGLACFHEPESYTVFCKSLMSDLLTTRNADFIPLPNLFLMAEYPNDCLPFYAESLSVTRFLIKECGKEKFLAFIDDVMDGRIGSDSIVHSKSSLELWDKAVLRHYGYDDVIALQRSWLDSCEETLP